MEIRGLKKQGGQGMVGLLTAILFVLVPLALAVNYISKVGDARHKSLEAARYATWERTVWHQSSSRYNRKSDIDISREINQRVFGEQDKALDSREDKQSVSADSINLDANLYAWDGGGERMLIPPEGSSELNNLTIAERRAPGSFSGIMNRVVGTMFGLDQNGFYNSTIRLNLFKKPDLELLGSEDLTLTSNNAMLVGAWNANGPAGVRSTVRRTVPTSLLDNSGFRTIRNMASSVGFRELGRFEPGKVEAEWIPCQRATGGNRSGRRCS